MNNSVEMYSVDEFATKAGINTAHTRQLLRQLGLAKNGELARGKPINI